MNRWAVRHADLIERDLRADEAVLGANRVVLIGASSVAMWARRTAASGQTAGRNPVSTRRLAPHQLKLKVAKQLGFPLPGWIFAIGLSRQRLLFWRTSRLLATPEECTGSIPLEQVASVGAPRRLGATRLSIVLGEGGMLVVQALWSRELANIAREFDRLRTGGDEG